MSETTGKQQRIVALDYTKGALVLLMVLYHWLNYFVGNSGYYYRYIRFITPSFIFIAGFLVSTIYLSRGAIDSRIPKRLVIRGLKVFAIFVVLNVLVRLLLRAQASETISYGQVLVSYLTGNILIGAHQRLAAFYILVPISCVLILSGALVAAYKLSRYVFHAVCAAFFILIFLLSLRGQESPNLEMVTIGLFGVLIGYVPLQKIKTFLGHPLVLATAYVGYLVAISVWNVTYPLQVIGVCLSLIVIYLIAERSEDGSKVQETIVLLGKYSLFGYIIQIAILQFLHRAFQLVRLNELFTLIVSFIAVMALTIILVDVMDGMRARSSAVNRLYTEVFG